MFEYKICGISITHWYAYNIQGPFRHGHPHGNIKYTFQKGHNSDATSEDVNKTKIALYDAGKRIKWLS